MQSHASRRPAVAALALLIAGGALALMPAWSASAHSAVVDSTPAEDAILTTLPETFSLTANEDLLDVTGEASGFALQIVDAAGLHYEQECPVVDGTDLATRAAIGEAGEYEVRYQFVSADGHAVSGVIPFEWAPDGEFELTVGTEASLCGDAPSETDIESTPPPGAVNDGADAEEGGAEPITPIADTSNPLFWAVGILAILAVIATIIAVIVKTRRNSEGH